MPFSFIPITQASFPWFYELLETSFPADERRSRSSQLALLDHTDYHAFTDPENRFLLTVWDLPGFTFIEHFAVEPELRSQGLGGAVLDQFLARCGLVVLEAELPVTSISSRRLTFYRRHGFTECPQPYLQPAYGPDRKPVPMHLLSSAYLSEDQFNQVRDTLYQQVYKTETI